MTKSKKSPSTSPRIDPLLALEEHHSDIAEIQQALNSLPSIFLKNKEKMEEYINKLTEVIIGHINRHEGVLLEMKGVKNFGDKPKEEVTKRVNGDVIEWAITYIQDGLDVLKKQFEREE